MPIPKRIDNHLLRLACPLLLLLLLLSGCIAGQASFNKGNEALEAEDYDQAVIEYLDAVERNPAKHEYRLKLDQTRNKAAIQHKNKGDDLLAQGQLVNAIQEYQLATDLDGSLYAAFDGLERARDYLKVEKLLQEARKMLQTDRKTQAQEAVNTALSLRHNYPPALQLMAEVKQSQYALVDGVELEVISSEPINLNFRDTKIPDVFDILTKLSGINFILDEEVRTDKTTLFLEQATFAQALELLLRMNKLDKKILNKKTIILFPKTRNKQKQFEDQIIQTFYLSHIDAKKAVNMLRTMLEVRKIYVQEDLNAIVIRDQPDVIRLAQKIIEATDRGNSEVVFDLELIEVNHSDTRELGLKLSNYSISAGLSAEGSGAIVGSGLSAGDSTSGLIESFSGLDPFYTLPTASFRFMKTLVNAEILANPKIRVKNNEKARVHVGSREPIITVTTTDFQTSENIQYIDVGVKLNVEPRIELNGTIITKLGLEVSNVSGRERTQSGTVAITISSTNADTTLTLKDGEQTVIGGLIRDDESVTKNKLPILGDIPIVGEIFNGTGTTKTKREILLSITPHIVKSVHVPQGDTASIWSGGEDDLKFGRNFGTFVDEYQADQQGMKPQVKLPEQQGKSPENNKHLESEVITEPGVISDTIIEERLSEKALFEQPYSSMLRVEGIDRINQGQEFSLSFKIEQVTDLFSAALHIHYDPAVVEFVSATEGSLLNQGGVSTLFTHSTNKQEGQIVVGLKQGADGQGVSKAGELFSLQFIATVAGATEIKPTLTTLRNTRGEKIDVDSFGLMVEVAP